MEVMNGACSAMGKREECLGEAGQIMLQTQIGNNPYGSFDPGHVCVWCKKRRPDKYAPVKDICLSCAQASKIGRECEEATINWGLNEDSLVDQPTFAKGGRKLTLETWTKMGGGSPYEFCSVPEIRIRCSMIKPSLHAFCDRNGMMVRSSLLEDEVAVRDVKTQKAKCCKPMPLTKMTCMQYITVSAELRPPGSKTLDEICTENGMVVKDAAQLRRSLNQFDPNVPAKVMQLCCKSIVDVTTESVSIEETTTESAGVEVTTKAANVGVACSLINDECADDLCEITKLTEICSAVQMEVRPDVDSIEAKVDPNDLTAVHEMCCAQIVEETTTESIAATKMTCAQYKASVPEGSKTLDEICTEKSKTVKEDAELNALSDVFDPTETSKIEQFCCAPMKMTCAQYKASAPEGSKTLDEICTEKGKTVKEDVELNELPDVFVPTDTSKIEQFCCAPMKMTCAQYKASAPEGSKTLDEICTEKGKTVKEDEELNELLDVFDPTETSKIEQFCCASIVDVTTESVTNVQKRVTCGEMGHLLNLFCQDHEKVVVSNLAKVTNTFDPENSADVERFCCEEPVRSQTSDTTTCAEEERKGVLPRLCDDYDRVPKTPYPSVAVPATSIALLAAPHCGPSVCKHITQTELDDLPALSAKTRCESLGCTYFVDKEDPFKPKRLCMESTTLTSEPRVVNGVLDAVSLQKTLGELAGAVKALQQQDGKSDSTPRQVVEA
eukprot:g2013.t1